MSDYDNFLNLVRTRRSIRSFEPKPIPENYIERILETARWAPSGANSQPWEFIVVKDKGLKKEIVEIIKRVYLVNDGSKKRKPRPRGRISFGFKDAPVFIIVCGDIRRRIFYPSTKFHVVNGKINVSTNPRIEIVFNSSLANAFLYIQLAARTLGLGSQWVSVIAHPDIQPETKQLLKIPENLVIYDMVALGYPAITPNPRSVRTLEEITHYNSYDETKSRDDNEIIDSAREFWSSSK